MLLTQLFKDIFDRSSKKNLAALLGEESASTVLNVGGGSKSISIPEHYRSWRHLLLDIDPRSGADIVLDARRLASLPTGTVDAVYCSHNLEHYYRHDVKTVLAGFLHVLKPGGFAEIHVPDMRGVLTQFVVSNMDIDDPLYQSPSGPISVHDVVYGYGKQIEESGVDFYAHKSGFTEATLREALAQAGFTHVYMANSEDHFSLGTLAFKSEPTTFQRALLHLSPD
jgi:SAM-dependent methyltransferase